MQIKHTNTLETGSEEWEISGNDIEELVSTSLNRVRAKSKDYYSKKLLKDLKEKGVSYIDHHAGMGTYYKVVLY